MQQQQAQQAQLQQQNTSLFAPQQPLAPQPTGFGWVTSTSYPLIYLLYLIRTNNPFAPSPSAFSPAQLGPSPTASRGPSFNLQGTYANSSAPSFTSSPSITPSISHSSSPVSGPAQGRPPIVKTKNDEQHAQLASLFANKDDGMDTFGNTGILRYVSIYFQCGACEFNSHPRLGTVSQTPPGSLPPKLEATIRSLGNSSNRAPTSLSLISSPACSPVNPVLPFFIPDVIYVPFVVHSSTHTCLVVESFRDYGHNLHSFYACGSLSLLPKFHIQLPLIWDTISLYYVPTVRIIMIWGALETAQAVRQSVGCMLTRMLVYSTIYGGACKRAICKTTCKL